MNLTKGESELDLTKSIMNINRQTSKTLKYKKTSIIDISIVKKCDNL